MGQQTNLREHSGFRTTQNAPSKSTVPNALHTKLRDSGQTGRLNSHSKYKRAQQHDDGKAWDLGALCFSNLLLLEILDIRQTSH